MTTPKTMDGQDWSLLILLSVLWGGAYFFAGVAVKELPPLTVVLARVLLAAVALLPLFCTSAIPCRSPFPAGCLTSAWGF